VAAIMEVVNAAVIKALRLLQIMAFNTEINIDM